MKILIMKTTMRVVGRFSKTFLQFVIFVVIRRIVCSTFYLTHSMPVLPSYRNQSIDFHGSVKLQCFSHLADIKLLKLQNF